MIFEVGVVVMVLVVVSYVDCDDWDCDDDAACGGSGGGTGEDEVCDDGIDNDGDSYVDCDGYGYTGASWSGDAATPSVGWDCGPQDATVYPAATVTSSES